MDDETNAQAPSEATIGTPWWIYATLGLFVVGGWFAYLALTRMTETIPPEIAIDPLLTRGREVYLANCVACHGVSGLGDGPLAKNLNPRPRNLAQEPWKYGDKPDQVLAVLTNGVKDAQMPAFAGTFAAADLKAVAAYVYQIARKPVPEALRERP